MALPVYAMSCFRLSKFQCKQITSAMTNFWWNATKEKNKIHWVSWKNVCRSKAKGGLGFRDVGDFNQALLAKQDWRILNEPNSLLAQVYKSRYFSTKDILECGKGYRPSYAWTSILHGRELLQRGLLKSVGNGAKTKVWLEKWIMDVHPRRPVNKQSLFDLELSVKDLLDNNGKWSMNVLNELFPPNDVKRIAEMSIGSVEDMFIRPYNDHGAYSVKSGYWFAADQPLIPDPPLDSAEIRRIGIKQRIWRIQTTPKIKMFMWRAVAGALAVSDRLRTRGMDVDNACKLCQSAVETINHVLFTCSVATTIWSSVGLPDVSSCFSHVFEDNLSYIIDLLEDTRMQQEARSALPWVLWHVWKNQNSILYAQKQTALSMVVQLALEESVLWYGVNENGEERLNDGRNNMRGEVRWQAPVEGSVKCNVNSKWRNASFLNGGAWMVRDTAGSALFHARDALSRSPNRITSELQCVIWAMTSIKYLHFSDVVVGLDCKAAFEAIKKPFDWPRYHSLLAQIHNLRSCFDFIGFELESISTNAIVRAIATSVTRDGRFNSYLAAGGSAWSHDLLAREASF